MTGQPDDVTPAPAQGAGVTPSTVEAEVVAALAAEPYLLEVAADLCVAIGESDGGAAFAPRLYGQAFEIAVLDGWRRTGGVRACPVWGPAAAVRYVLASMADSMAQAAGRIPPDGPQAGLRAALEAGSGRIRAALDPGGG